ncbi:hypothetical protein AXG93_1647s1000 [Marchantia polymorpha subsp. ruderalis]|uniref:Reverse transcriptase/retrotransposon-derived protein RNase H-like domain-containing protein n=1 Tax=Marchantia polymorpha subsp. ruderalis TaxID=1480154 RepID=A0A176VEV9_MARPO|nr:hypothetical protein AXG93_1647s1000 [Marchantia polymorpha subsp. ruderalis]
MTSGILLGHRVSAEGIAVDEEKVKVILALEPPMNLRELRAFLRHVGYYRRFMNMYAITAASLTKLLRKDELYEWGEEQKKAFEELKDKLISASILRRPDWNKPYRLDTSAFAIGVAVLSQRDDNRRDYSIYFASRQFLAAKKNYTTTKQEALGMMFADRMRSNVPSSSIRLVLIICNKASSSNYCQMNDYVDVWKLRRLDEWSQHYTAEKVGRVVATMHTEDA